MRRGYKLTLQITENFGISMQGGKLLFFYAWKPYNSNHKITKIIKLFLLTVYLTPSLIKSA